MREFTSVLALLLQDYVSFRKAADRWSSSYEQHLFNFDKYYKSNYPNATELTQEITDQWCCKRKSETNNSCRSRTAVVVDLIRYLQQRGKTSVDVPVRPRLERCTYIPHAFSKTELKNFFRACDEIPHQPGTMNQLRKITVPVFFRLLYSSGMRPFEARMLKLEDVDLNSGVLNIHHSKGSSQHYVVLHELMLDLMEQYDESAGKLIPNRVYFFPSPRNSFRTHSGIEWNFHQMWNKYNTVHAIVYDLRHNYAIQNINGWVGLGFEFHDKLLYLSKSMGHTRLDSTRYYYHLVPSFADILKSHSDNDVIIPEVRY